MPMPPLHRGCIGFQTCHHFPRLKQDPLAMSDKNVESMLERFTWRMLANHVSPWELEQLKQRIERWDDWCAEFSKLAHEHVRAADDAAAAGRKLSAGNAYVRAASL